MKKLLQNAKKKIELQNAKKKKYFTIKLQKRFQYKIMESLFDARKNFLSNFTNYQ